MKILPLRTRAQGMVLVAVLWMVAALSLLVLGLTRSVRDETRMLGTSRSAVIAGGVGDAAIHLVLQQMMVEQRPVARMLQVDTEYRGVPVRVQIMPLTGLIDINGAPPALLANLYTFAGGLPRAAAESLAQATVDFRVRHDALGQDERFEATEDLLRVPGFTYGLYAKISALVTADVQGGGRVNPLAAPVDVLFVLAGGDAQIAARIAASRDAGQEGVDTTALQQGFVDTSASQRFRLDAKVPLGDGAWVLVSRSVDIGNFPRDGLPWRTFRTDLLVQGMAGNNS